MNASTKICLSMLLIMAIISPSLAKTSAFVKDNSGKDLQDLESMLSGEHRGAQYGQSISTIYSSPPSPTGPLYDPPYKNSFLNDTFFGDFLRQLDGHPAANQTNLTWSETYLAGSPYMGINSTVKPAEAGRHHIKPILLKEPPDF